MYGVILPILICIIPQLWRRMHGKDIYDNHFSNGSAGSSHQHNLLTTGSNSDETHPFLPLAATGAGQSVRTNMSTRQFNESPSFQRLNANTSSQTNSTLSNTASLSRSRYHSARQNSTTNNNNGTTAANNALMTSRIDEFGALNTDPYLVLGKSNPSAPPALNNGNLLNAINENSTNNFYTLNQPQLQNNYLQQQQQQQYPLTNSLISNSLAAAANSSNNSYYYTNNAAGNNNSNSNNKIYNSNTLNPNKYNHTLLASSGTK